MKTPLSGLSDLLAFVVLSVAAPLHAQHVHQPTSQPTSAPASDCPIRPLITATLAKSAPKFDYELTPLGTPPITITVTAPPVIQPDDSIHLSDMRFETRGLNDE